MGDFPGWERQTKPSPGAPYCWVQWKGTDACMDFHCACGFFGHIDGDFLYYLRCPECKVVYMVNGHVELVPLTADEAQTVESPVEVPDDDV